MRPFLTLLLFAAAVAGSRAETGHEAWLRYPPIQDAAVRQQYASLPAVVVVTGDSPILLTARDELIRGVQGLLGRTLRIERTVPTSESAIVLGEASALPASLAIEGDLAPDAFWLTTREVSGHRCLVIAGANPRAVLYGTFALLRKMALHDRVDAVNERQIPYAPARWINHWDNLDGTIERGYGGRSLFFDNNNVREDLGPVRDYARLLASLGINAITINNVNANTRVISAEFLPQVARIADAFRPLGVQVGLAVDFSSPQRMGGLDTFDPLDPRVAEWWRSKVDEIYRVIPDLAGFVVKADSEGRLGPSAYHRTHADAANVIARPLQRHNGLLFYRGFVYDHHMDWRNLKNDRARAAYDNFIQLDGKFEPNAIIQIKHGPIDFQVREPASPLFGALEKTNEAIELQITQEYFGQSRHMVFLVPMWKEALDFDMHAGAGPTPVKALAAGKIFARPAGGFVGVSNAGLDANWFGHPLSQANLYGFGRLAWNPNLTSAQIIDEWTKQTFSHDPLVVETIDAMQLASWRNFENYTGPLGLQTLTEITGNHYGPAVEASERNGWGQWHRSDETGAGMDRTVATGTGYIGQYRPAVASVYESLATCPDELLLFMHHVPYTYVLHSGKTVIQEIYDKHFAGAAAAADYVRQWRSLEHRIDEPRYRDVLQRLEYQAGHAEVWRDAVNSWFRKTSGIPDRLRRISSPPGRFEAENLSLDGYVPVVVQRFETASQGKAIRCDNASKGCSASLKLDNSAGWYDLNIRYFDQDNGVSHFRLLVSGQLIAEWDAADHIPTRSLDGHSATRRLIRGVALRPGDIIRIEGIPNGGEPAALDFIEIHRAK